MPACRLHRGPALRRFRRYLAYPAMTEDRVDPVLGLALALCLIDNDRVHAHLLNAKTRPCEQRRAVNVPSRPYAICLLSVENHFRGRLYATFCSVLSASLRSAVAGSRGRLQEGRPPCGEPLTRLMHSRCGTVLILLGKSSQLMQRISKEASAQCLTRCLPDLYAALFSRWRRRFAFSSRLISTANSGLAGS